MDAATLLAERRNMASRARFVVADATLTGFSSRSVAGVMSVDALMFIDPERVAKEIGRLLNGIAQARKEGRPHGRPAK